MGLTIAREIVRAHGGDIWVREPRRTGLGVLYLRPRGRGGKPGVSAGRILVVDDEPQIRRVMRTTLAAHGYEVEDARSGEEALEKLRADIYDLVLLDINMPGMGGVETCRTIRQERRGSELAIIMLTVRSAESDKVEALDAGADDYVTKPFSTPELLARVRATLRRMPPERTRITADELGGRRD